MKPYLVWILSGLTLIGMLALSSIAFAGEEKWTKKADMPIAKALLSTSAVNGKIYAIGGIGGGATVEEYDPITNKWTKKADMLTPRSSLSTSSVNGKIYAIGGWLALATVEEYDPATDKWTKKVDMPTQRRWLSASAVNGKVYAIGGSSNIDPLSTVEEYDPGLAGLGIEAKGKLDTSWGQIKFSY